MYFGSSRSSERDEGILGWIILILFVAAFAPVSVATERPSILYGIFARAFWFGVGMLTMYLVWK